VSVLVPAANGQSTVTGRVGQASAADASGAAAKSQIAAAATAPTHRHTSVPVIASFQRAWRLAVIATSERG